MATIGFKANADDIHDDLDFSFDDFNFDVEEPKDDRHPVLKALKPVGRGAKEYVTNSSNIERFVKAAMPVGYGQAYDLFSEAKGELRQLYNNAGKEIKPVKETAKSLLRKTLPSLDGKIPKGLKKKLEEMSKEDEQWRPRQGNEREDQLGSLLTSIFEQKASDELRNRNETNEREKLHQGFEQIRHRDQISQLDAIRLAVEAQVQYQNKVTFNVQKKQLELNYRMFWAMADLNKEQKRSNAEMLAELKATRMNTGLPDFVKQTSHERFKEIVRNKFLDNAREGMFGGAQDYVRKFTRNVGDQLLGKVRNYTMGANAIGGAAETAADTVQGMNGMPGFSARDEMIAGLTQFPMDWAANKGSKYLSQILGKNAQIRRGGNAASHFVNTAGDRLHERLTSQNHSWGAFEGLREILAQAAPSRTPESRMEVDSLDRMHLPKPFNRSNSKSLDEVIPGLLARIHREIKILRTGDESADLITYDYGKNRFTTDKKLGGELRQRLAGHSTERANRHANTILDRVDRGGKLSEEQREKARKMLVEKAVMGESIDIKNIWKGDQWGGDEDGEAIANTFNHYLRGKDGKISHNNQAYLRQLSLLQQHRGIVGGVGDPRVILQQMVNTGQLDTLKEIGIIDQHNSVDRKLFAKWLAGETDTPAPTPPIPSTTVNPNPGRKVSRNRNGRNNQSNTGRGSGRGPSAPGIPPSLSAIDLSQFGSTPNSGRFDEEALNELRSISSLLRERETPTPVQNTVESNVQKIVEILVSLDQKYEHASSENFNVLTEMLNRLREMGTGMPSGSSANPNSADDSNSDNPNGGRNYSSLWHHFKDSTWDGLVRTKNFTKKHSSNLWNKYSPGAKSGASRAWEASGNSLGKLRNKIQSVYGDVVVNGEHMPRLRASLLTAGAYRDKVTGRIITSLEDITGDVVDANGNLVITMEEFYNSYVTGSVNKAVKELFSNAKRHLEDWKDRFQAYMPGAITRMKGRVSQLMDKVKGILPPYDVYVKTDMTRPVLYASLMKQEKYFSQQTNKPLRHPREIDGPIVDEQGNVLLNEDQIKDGLVDAAGDSIGAGRLITKLTKKAKLGWEVLRNAAVGLFGAIGNGLGNAGDYLKNFFAPFTDMITNSKKTVTLLEQIHTLLDERMPAKKKKVKGDSDGDGIRDGSIEDQKRRKSNAGLGMGAFNIDPNNPDGKGPGGVGSLLKGLSGLFKKQREDEKADREEEDGEWGLDDLGNIAEIGDFLNGDGHRGERGSKDRRRAAKKRLKRMRGRNNPGMMRRLASRLPGVGGRAAGAAGAAGAAAAGAGAAGAAAGGSRLARLLKWGTFNTDLVAGGATAAGAVARPLASGASKLAGGAASLAGRVGKGLMGESKLAQLARWGMFNTDIVKGMGKAAGYGLKGLKYLPKALGAAGTAYSAYSAYNNVKEGNYGSAAIDAGLGLGGLALTGGGMAGLMGAGGAVLGGIGTILASPLLLPALGIAAAGGAAYMAFKYFTKTKVTDMSKVRLAQYGINFEDKDSLEKAFQLETLLEPHAIVKEGKVEIDKDKVDLKEVAKLFGVGEKNDLPLFNGWYTRRFLPVFGYWLSALRKISPNAKMGDVESAVPGKDKLRFTESSVNGLSDVYSYMGGWSQAHPKLAFGIDGVKQVMDSVRAGLMKEVQRGGGKEATVSALSSVAATPAEASKLAEKALTDKEHYVTKDKDGNIIDPSAMQYGELRDKITKGEVTVDVAVSLPKELVKTDASRLDALTTIRYKAYGLTYMTADKVRMLSALEQFMADQLIGDVENPKLKMSTDTAMQVAGKVFGVPNESGEHAQRWKAWFNGRFLPVFLLWAGTIRQKTGKDKVADAMKEFPMVDQAALARAIVGAKGKNSLGSTTPIWNVTSNPWADAFEMNTDPDSTKGNLEAIRVVADKVRLGEVSATNGKTHQTSKEVSDSEKGWFGSMKRTVGNWFGKDWSPKGEGANANGDSLLKGGADAKPLSGMGESLKFSAGSGGSYASLPASQGNGWAANKALLMGAAQMAGVDPKGLASLIAMESAFNPNAAPKNPNLPSSAKGFGQHLDGTWLEDLQRDGKKFGIPNGTTQFDPRASAVMTAAHMKYIADLMKKKLGREVTLTDTYLAHLMGPGGAGSFLKAPADAIASEVAATTAKQHPNYFFEGGKALTVKQVYEKIGKKLGQRAAEFGVSDTDFANANIPTTSPTQTVAAPVTDATKSPADSKPVSTPAGGAGATAKTTVNFTPLRETATATAAAPNKETASAVAYPTFKPKGPETTTSTPADVSPAKTTTSSDLPRLNSTESSFGAWGPTKNDMQKRDAAMAEVIAPKLDNVATKLQNGLFDSKSGVPLLQKILEALLTAKTAEAPKSAPSNVADSKAKPVTDTGVPVPQRRNY